MDDEADDEAQRQRVMQRNLWDRARQMPLDPGRRHADVTPMRTKHTFRLPPDLAGKLADYAARKGVPQALVVEAALASHLSPDGADRLEAALARRLDRMTRHMERIERHVDISNEALAVFVRFWLTSTPPLPDAALPAAQTQGPRALRGLRRSARAASRPWP